MQGKCVTVFSAPKYCDQGVNLGAYIVFDKTMIPQYHKVYRLNISIVF